MMKSEKRSARAIKIGVAFIFLSFYGCNSAPDGFCECLVKGNAVNLKSNEVLRGNLDEDTKKDLLRLRKEQKEACAPFVANAGAQMREWKKECEEK